MIDPETIMALQALYYLLGIIGWAVVTLWMMVVMMPGEDDE